MKVTSTYNGEVKTPDGKKYTFTIEGASQSEIKGLMKSAQPDAKVKFKNNKPCPGSKIRSKGKGRGLGIGQGKGPIDRHK